MAIVEEKKRFTYEALGQILTYRYLFEAVWNAKVHILIIVRNSDEELHPSEEAILYTCRKLEKELGLVIKCIKIS